MNKEYIIRSHNGSCSSLRNAMMICHCGGGGRSALAADNLKKMG